MTRDEAKIILQLYRPATADAEDPQITEALALAKQDSELARWLEKHCAWQNALREKFRQIEIPPGLKEQIISEQMSNSRAKERREKIAGVAAIAAIVVSLAILVSLYFPYRENGNPKNSNTLVDFQNQMVSLAASPYGMPLATNDLGQIQDYLAKNHGVADYKLTVPLERAAATGCAVKYWSGVRVSMICFRTGKPLAPDRQGDLWLFVVDHASVKGAPDAASPQFAKVNQLVTATWTQGGKLYLLATEGDEQTLRKFL
jgi:hypothetical protein